jgi:RNA polymerase sigma-70 factor (ECF subfamily)
VGSTDRGNDPSHSVDAPHPSDHYLVERLRSNDEGALTELIQHYTPTLVEIAGAIVGSRDAAQDVVQDVFCWIWDTRTRLEIHGSVIGYLVRAIRNRAYSAIRRERSQQRTRERLSARYTETFPHAHNVGDTDITAAEFQQALTIALQTLQTRTRQVFLMHVDHGLSYTEIAEALDITVPTVRMQMYRATKQLAKRLSGWL